MTSEKAGYCPRFGGPEMPIAARSSDAFMSFPSRITKDGLRITEICLADGEKSRVQ